MNFNKLPGKYISSDIPIYIEFQSTSQIDDERLILNTVFEEIPIDSIQLDSVTLPYSKIEFTWEHPFETGDRVVVYHDDQTYNGEYLITESDNSPGSYYIVIDLVLTTPFDLDGAFVGKTIKMSNDQNPASINPSPLLKNKVTSSIDGDATQMGYDADSNRWNHKYFIGREYNVQEEITGIVFTSGDVSFQINATQSDLKVGDEIFIEIDDKLWEYDDNFFDSGYLGFISSNTHYLREDIPIFVNGQITEPSYNGNHTVREVPTTQSIVTNTPWIDSTPVEGGQIVYQPYPEWNKKKVEVKGLSTFSGKVTVETDFAWIQNDPNVTGKITKVGDRVRTIKEEASQSKILFNSTFDYKDYDADLMKDYVIKELSIPLDISLEDNHISTTRNLPSERLRYNLIPKDGKEHLLIHNDESGFDTVRVTFLDQNKSTLSVIDYSIFAGSKSQYYPISIDDLLTNTSGAVVSGSPLSSIQDDVHYYEVELLGNPNKAVYFPDDVGVENRLLTTNTTYLVPQNSFQTEFTAYMLFDAELIETNGSSATYDLFKIESSIISIVYDGINEEFTHIRYEDDSVSGYNIPIDTTQTDLSNGTEFLLTFSKIESSGDIKVGLTNINYDSFTDVTDKPVSLSTNSSNLEINPNHTNEKFIGTIHWFNVYSEPDKRESTDFTDSFKPSSWLAFDESNTTQQTDLYSWFDFNEGEIFEQFTYVNNSDRYDSTSGSFSLITLDDSGKYGTPAVEDTLTTTSLGDTISSKTLYRVDKRCERFIDILYLSFIDSLGSLTCIPFKMKNKRSIEASRSKFYKKPTLDTTTKQGGDTQYHVKSRRVYELTTDFYTEQLDSNTFIEDLFRSIEIYLHDPSNGEFLPVTLDTSTVDIETAADDGVYNYSFNVIEAIDNHRY